MTSWVSATMRMRSPAAAPVRSMTARCVSSERNFTIGPLRLPSASIERCARPFAPNRLARSVSSSISRRVTPAMPGRHDRLHATARGQRRIEHDEAGGPLTVRPGQRRCQVHELHPEPDVRLVRPEALDRLLEGEDRERHAEDRSLGGRRRGDLDRHRFDEAHHGRLVHEAHLEVELRELGLPVAAEVLVAIAAGDLEVAIDTGHHQQLLELLRALRQGVHAARLEPARHDEVAGAFGRALDQGRRLDLDEAVAVVDLADRLDHPAAQEQTLLHRLAADVEVAVLEPDRLIDGCVGIVDVEGRRLRLGQDLDLGRLDLDRARRQLRVLGAWEALAPRSRERRPRTRSGPGWPPRGPRARRPCR